jgi:hypothetical protein
MIVGIKNHAEMAALDGGGRGGLVICLTSQVVR